MGLSARDEAATAGRKFRDERSYVTIGGQEFLYGKDMGDRRWDVWVRDGGRCFACERPMFFEDCDLEHSVPYSAGGDDSLENLRISCSGCNHARHPHGVKRTG